MIRLSLSGRLFESPKGYVLNRDEFLSFASATGYGGVELRYPQVPMETPPDEVARVRARLAELGLTWVFGTVEGIHEPGLYERSVTTMKQHVAGGARFTRFTVFKPEQVAAAREFADEAARLDHTLLMQVHCNTMADNVPHSLELLRQLDRPNVRLAFDATHLVFDGDTRYVDAVARLAPHISTVSIQNYKPAPANSPADHIVKIGGSDYVRGLPGDPAGIDFPIVFDALKKIGFNGWATVMCDAMPGMDPRELAETWYGYLKPLC